MPRLVINRKRHFCLKLKNPKFLTNTFWEKTNIYVYTVGALLFIIGSVLYFPALQKWQFIGDWLFAVGSVLYLLVTGHDLLETLIYRHRHHSGNSVNIMIEIIASLNYVFGSLLFTIGSIFFLFPGEVWTSAGAWCFIIGSLGFVIGCSANLWQIVTAPSLLYLQLSNFSLVTFIIGAILFIFATIPFLQEYNSTVGQYNVNNLSAGTFVFASFLFLFGGIMMYLRITVKQIAENNPATSRAGQNFITAILHEIDAKDDANPLS